MTTQPLSRGQQLMLQRLMAAHVMNDEEAKALFEHLNDTNCSSLEQFWKEINAQLSVGFGLEIATVSLNGERYHAVINQHSDEIAKNAFPKTLDPHERAYVRSILEKLVEQETCNRMELINLRTEPPKPYKMITLAKAEKVLDNLIDERWMATKNKESRRASMSQQYHLGPRSYLELTHLLKDFGLEDPPQMIFHRA